MVYRRRKGEDQVRPYNMIRVYLALCAVLTAISCEEGNTYAEFGVRCPSFLDGETVPIRHTCDGGHLSPAMYFDDFPLETKSFAVVMDYKPQDAPPFVHWVMWGISSSSNFLGQDQNGNTREGAVLGTNSAGTLGYYGPCPLPGNTHVFTIRVYALDREITLAEGNGKGQLESAMDGHIIGVGKISGRYSR